MKIVTPMSESTMIEELGLRAQQQRVGMNLTQIQLANAAGVSPRTIERFEAGSSIQLEKLLRILRVLRLIDNLDQLIPEVTVRPLQLVDGKSKIHKRAHVGRAAKKPTDWAWGDQK